MLSENIEKNIDISTIKCFRHWGKTIEYKNGKRYQGRGLGSRVLS